MPSPRWPVIAWRDDAPLRVLVEDFVRETAGVTYRVEAGFDRFDGASIPRWAWTGIGHPFMREYERAALVHDYLYGRPEAREAVGLGEDRAAVDRLFLAHLLEDGVSPAAAHVMWWAVQRFGEPRFRCAASEGLVGMDAAEVEALESDDCDCAEREIAALLAEDGGVDDNQERRWLREGLAVLDFGAIKARWKGLR